MNHSLRNAAFSGQFWLTMMLMMTTQRKKNMKQKNNKANSKVMKMKMTTKKT
ncbi:hypothetical protein L195_g024602 [Trifolium pratense]|uniref:Uncharacterized protein n=1 Tax=Trifolium pratense TaxID=57577 RepID=A0A2K3NE57_TRIPR|nr:hypothetical protein L195_g024602 [Trifolium pratense]